LPTAALDDPEGPGDELRLYVCITCRAAGMPEDAVRPGARLHEALAEALAREALARAGNGLPPVRLLPVQCLSVCKRPCTVAVTAPGRWTYVYGDLDPDHSVPAILDGLSRYGATVDGIVPWRERPEIFRKGVVARIPPFLSPADERS
jgi:predicted metal-binding protein